MKVVQVVECGGPGGTGHQVAAICRGLDPERFEVVLVFAVRSGTPADYLASCGGPKAHYVPEMAREISPLRDLRALGKLAAILRREKPDVVHAHSSKAGALARPAARLAGVPRLYYSPRGYGFLQQDRGPLSRALYRAAERAVSWIGEIVAVSPSEAELARPLARGRPVHVVADAFLGGVPEASEAPAGREIVVGGCGRMTHARNMEAFVSLCQRLTDSRNGLRCLWVGGGEEEVVVRRNLENLNLLGRVEVTGWLARPESLRRLREISIFVHYSRWEGLPNAVLEAMALGLPVVASDIPGNRDAVVHGDTGFLARSESELLEFCQKLIDDAALRMRLGRAGRERALREFSPERMISQLSRLYSA